MNINYPSKLLETAVNEFSRFPGIGEKTALRLVLYLLRQDKEEIINFGKSIIQLSEEIKYCRTCQNISDTEICNICNDSSRDHSTVCIVENIKDVISIENTQQYKGVYHVLGGIISPIDGIGPNDLTIESLNKKISEGNIKELILALSTTLEGDTTNFYLYKKFKQHKIRITTLARGVSVGDELEYTDEITLGRSILNRTLFEVTLSDNK
ncbi:MAG: recombination protein RecR [Bacteroidales bacterium]|nr:MAG: recombination protein RecR [Bacteroidales bacterium]